MRLAGEESDEAPETCHGPRQPHLESIGFAEDWSANHAMCIAVSCECACRAHRHTTCGDGWTEPTSRAQGWSDLSFVHRPVFTAPPRTIDKTKRIGQSRPEDETTTKNRPVSGMRNDSILFILAFIESFNA